MLETSKLVTLQGAATRLAMGGCPLGGHDWGAVDRAAAVDAVREAWERGVSLFDTADCYGLGASEELLAEALGSDRHGAVIASKFGVRWDAQGRTRRDASPAYAAAAVEASLRRLRLDVIPVYFLHWPDGSTPIEETVEALRRLRQAGKIEKIGLSNVDVDGLRRAASVAVVDVVQVRGSLIHQEHFQTVFPAARELGACVWTWGSLGEGLLTGKFDAATSFPGNDRRSRYPEFQGPAFARNLELAARVKEVAAVEGRTPAQVALRWLLDTPGVDGCLFGAKRPGQVVENLGADGWRLSTDNYSWLATG